MTTSELDPPPLPSLGSEPGLAAEFAHAIGIDQAVRSAMEPPPMLRMPVLPAETIVEPSPEEASEIAEIKARLAARGLLATRPQIVVPKEPRTAADVPTLIFAPEPADPSGTQSGGFEDWRASELDDWDVQPGNEETTVRCPQCRDVYIRPLEATRFSCPTCDRSWRWAVCRGCDQLAVAIERQESWRCGCGHFNRSWWRTSTAMRDGIDVVARRKHQAVEAERRRVREGMRRRRWKLIALAIWSAVAAVAIVVGVRVAESAPGGSDATCAHWLRLRSDITNGTIVGGELRAEMDALLGEAESASAEIQTAVSDVASAKAGSTGFLSARAALSDICEGSN